MDRLHKAPLFPLPLLLLPGESLQLHVFEERYKSLVNQALSQNTGFGIPCRSLLNIANLGSWVVIKQVLKRYDTGELDVEVRCDGLFVLKNFYYPNEDVQFPGGKILFYEPEWLKLEEGSPLDELLESALIAQLDLKEKFKLLRLKDSVSRRKFLDNRSKLIEMLRKQEDAVYENLYLN